MVKGFDSRWYLKRIGSDEIVELQKTTSVGRDRKSNLRIRSTYCSKCHCVFIVDSNNEVAVKDLGSSNGVFVNNVRWHNDEIFLKEGDRVGIGCIGSDSDCESKKNLFIYKLHRCKEDTTDTEKQNELSKLPEKIESTQQKVLDLIVIDSDGDEEQEIESRHKKNSAKIDSNHASPKRDEEKEVQEEISKTDQSTTSRIRKAADTFGPPTKKRRLRISSSDSETDDIHNGGSTSNFQKTSCRRSTRSNNLVRSESSVDMEEKVVDLTSREPSRRQSEASNSSSSSIEFIACENHNTTLNKLSNQNKVTRNSHSSQKDAGLFESDLKEKSRVQENLDHGPVTSERKISASDRRHSTSERKMSTSDRRPSTSERKMSTLDRRPSTSERKRSTSDRRPSTSERKRPTSDRRPSISERKRPTSDRTRSTSERKMSTSDRRPSTSERKMSTSDRRPSTSERKRPTSDRRPSTSERKRSTPDRRPSTLYSKRSTVHRCSSPSTIELWEESKSSSRNSAQRRMSLSRLVNESSDKTTSRQESKLPKEGATSKEKPKPVQNLSKRPHADENINDNRGSAVDYGSGPSSHPIDKRRTSRKPSTNSSSKMEISKKTDENINDNRGSAVDYGSGPSSHPINKRRTSRKPSTNSSSKMEISKKTDNLEAEKVDSHRDSKPGKNSKEVAKPSKNAKNTSKVVSDRHSKPEESGENVKISRRLSCATKSDDVKNCSRRLLKPSNLAEPYDDPKPNKVTSRRKSSNQPSNSKKPIETTSTKSTECHPLSKENESPAIENQDREMDEDNFDVTDFNLSQGLLRDIKQEIMDLDLEESFDYKAEDEIDYKNEADYEILKPAGSISDLNNEHREGGDDDDDDDDDGGDSLSNWARKLSQSLDVFSNEKINIKAPQPSTSSLSSSRNQDELPVCESLVDYVCDVVEANIPNTSMQVEQNQLEKQGDTTDNKSRSILSDQGNSSIKTRSERRSLQIIQPPTLPKYKGKLRGVSAAPPTPKVDAVQDKLHRVKLIERNIRISTELQKKWRTKPTIQKKIEKEKKVVIKKERQQKLKEIAKEKLAQKQNTGSEVKVVNIPKCKLTRENRGHFLTETHTRSTPPKVKEPPKPPFKIPKVLVPKITKARNESVELQEFEDLDITPLIITRNLPEQTAKTPAVEPPSEVEKLPAVEKPLVKIQTRSSKEIVPIKNIQEKIVEEQGEKRPDEAVAIYVNSKVMVNNGIVSHKMNLKPILKLPGVKSKRKKVQFNESINQTQIFLIEDGNYTLRKVNQIKDKSIDMSPFLNTRRNKEEEKRGAPLPDHTNAVLNEILSWDPQWLIKGRASVNGPNHTLLPMMHQFATIDDFYRVVFPLLKLELWASIEQDADMNKKMKFYTAELKNMVVEMHGQFKRGFLSCEIRESVRHVSDFPIKQGDIAILKCRSGSDSYEVFAFVKNTQKIVFQTQSIIVVNVDINLTPRLHPIFNTVNTVEIKSITQIKVDLGAFNAIYRLKYSGLCQNILNPFALTAEQEVSIANVRYKGKDTLNENQQKILLKTYIKSIDRTRSSISLIEGPPGTGKSRLIKNLVLQLLYGDQQPFLSKKVLVCSQSNAAIDVIASQLLEVRRIMTSSKFNMVRFGPVQKIAKGVAGISLPALIACNLKSSPTDAELKALKNERMLLEVQLSNLNANKNRNTVTNDEKHKCIQRLEMINKLINQNVPHEIERQNGPRIIQGANVVCTTLSSCIKLLQHTNHFDVCIVDEATQCTEPWTLIPLQFGINALVLVGDTQQLPATVLSKTTMQYGFGDSLFTRIKKCVGPSKTNSIELLRTQYRMHPDICHWTNKYFYDNKLKTDSSISERKSPLVPYCILSLSFNQNFGNGEGQICNADEGLFVVNLITNMIKVAPVKQYSYGIITPYAHHRDYLAKKIENAGITNIQVQTVDSYQGQEKDIIIISNARTRGIGFLNNCQRLNVALTRARQCLILCGNFSNLERVPVWQSLLEDARHRGLFHQIEKSDPEDFSGVMQFVLEKQ